jgi:hypothetical protein
MTLKWMSRTWLLIAVAAACGWPGVALAQGQCRDDLVAAGQTFARSRADVEKAAKQPAPVRCSAYRQHVAALTQVRAVFTRCDTGAKKAENVGKVAASIGEFTKLVQQTCKP